LLEINSTLFLPMKQQQIEPETCVADID